MFQLTQEDIDSSNPSQDPTKVISLQDDDDDDDDDDVEEVFHWVCKSSFVPVFHPVSDPSHILTPEPNNNLSSVPYPQPSPEPSPDPGPDPIDIIINGTSKYFILIEDYDGYLAME